MTEWHQNRHDNTDTCPADSIVGIIYILRLFFTHITEHNDKNDKTNHCFCSGVGALSTNVYDNPRI